MAALAASLGGTPGRLSVAALAALKAARVATTITPRIEARPATPGAPEPQAAASPTATENAALAACLAADPYRGIVVDERPCESPTYAVRDRLRGVKLGFGDSWQEAVRDAMSHYPE